jgi:hypothetical protein
VLITCWSPKGGSGTTVITAALALAALRHGTEHVQLVDEAEPNDLAEVIGADPPSGVSLGSRGSAADGTGDDLVVVDVGSGAFIDEHRRALIQSSAQSLVIVRNCVLAIRQLLHCTNRVDGLIVVEESQRSLRCADVEQITSHRVIARVPVDPTIARAVDAGVLMTHPPRSLMRALNGVIAWN